MRKVKIFDTTLRDGEQSPGCSMNLSEKIVLARQLERLGVDIIEAGFAISSPMDFKSVQAIAQAAPECTIASLARCNKNDIDTAWEAVKDAKKPRIHVFIATSEVHMKYKLRMTPEQVLQTITDMVGYAKSKCPDIEFSAEDSSRSDREFLSKAFSNAIAAGANTINVPDTVGYSTPQEMGDLINYLREHVAGIDNVDISVHCHNDLGMGVANSLACIKAGATQVECTVNGIGERAGNASLEEIAMALRTRRDFYDADTNINTREIYKSSRLLSNITGVPIAPTKAIVGANAFAHEAGIHQHGMITNAQTYEIMNPDEIGIPHRALVLGKHSGKHALRERLESMGYEIPDDELEDIFTRFKKLADEKKTVTSSDLEALTLHRSRIIRPESGENSAPFCQLVSHSITSGSGVPKISYVQIRRSDTNKLMDGVESGAGPLDAAFKVINKMLGVEARLEDFSIRSVTEGEDSIGEAVVKISSASSGEMYTGSGISTDIVEASLAAYIAGINKMFEEEGTVISD
ncbi:MAG: 2-isopropylmalate synthase [Synergistaceae bacterium]|nr:2-isopropylmalate synthase [Synergistaceae bacterium]